MKHGRAREMGLGPIDLVTLAEAREAARNARRLLRENVDPIDQRRRAAGKAEAAMTFKKVAELYLDAHEAAWRGARTAAEWRLSLRRDAFPTLGALAVDQIGVAEVMAVLQPFWYTQPVLAGKLRRRIGAVLDFGNARGWRTGDNPARWRGHLENLLPAENRLRDPAHHPALPWREVPAFMAKLRQQSGMSPRVLEFVVLTASRSQEARGALWSELDFAHRVWVVPPSRMKGRREHRVPLSTAALALLERQRQERRDDEPLVFPGQARGKPSSVFAMGRLLARLGYGHVTVHGMRSTFRDWAAEATTYDAALAEISLGHKQGTSPSAPICDPICSNGGGA